MWIYWKERCFYCRNKNNCEYKERVAEFINKLTEIEKSMPKVYGTLDWKCDYYVLDIDLYLNENHGECESK